MARIAVMLVCLGGLYFYLSQNVQKPPSVNPDNRLQELFRLAGADSYLASGNKDPDTEKYLRQAIVFANENFGAQSRQAAEAHNRMGRYLSDLHSYGEETRKNAKEELALALELSDRLDKKPGEKPTIMQTKQKYILDLADLQEDFKVAEKLYDRALALGPFPLDKPGQVGHWYHYLRSLEDQSRYIEAARVYVEMETQRKIQLPSVQELSAQKVDSVTGRFAHLQNREKPVEDFKLALEAQSNKVSGHFSIIPINYDSKFFRPEAGSMEKQPVSGTFANGSLHCTLTYKGKKFPYFITRVGKYLVILDKPRNGPPSVSEPSPPDNLLLIQD